MSGEGLDPLFAAVTADQDRRRGQARAVHSQRRARFIDAVVRPQKAARWPWAMALAGAAAAAVLAWVLVPSAPPDDGPLQFTVATAPGVPGEWIAAGDDEVAIAFSDGTALSLEPHGRARIDPQADDTRVVLESGAVALDVVSHEGRGWRVEAGPFTTRVTGTRFEVAWKPESTEFTVRVHEGTVEVTGPAWSAPQAVTAGHVVRTRAPEVETERFTARVQDEATSPTAPPTEPADADEITIVDESEGTDVERDRGPARRPSARPDWKALAGEGDHEAAIEAAEAFGFTRLCKKLNARDLLALGESARFARKPARAEQALKAVRERFDGTGSAATAAYNLGLVAFDQRRAYSKAARWFSTYLDERPKGGLAREALGRQMEASSRAGEKAKARALAETYLRRYPEGPHRDLAERLRAP